MCCKITPYQLSDITLAKCGNYFINSFSELRRIQFSLQLRKTVNFNGAETLIIIVFYESRTPLIFQTERVE